MKHKPASNPHCVQAIDWDYGFFHTPPPLITLTEATGIIEIHVDAIVVYCYEIDARHVYRTYIA